MHHDHMPHPRLKHHNRHPRGNALLVQVALCLLVSFFIVFNVIYYQKVQRTRDAGLGGLRGHAWIDTATAVSFNQNDAATKATHLIMVAGHSVTISGHLRDADKDESDWFLLPYQKGKGLPNVIIKHVRAGIDVAASDPSSLLIFSGGETRSNAGPETEGSSYYRVADAMQMWKSNVRARTTTEEFATDSFENLLFSICRFYEVTGHYPERITVISFSFKQARFETMHAHAIRWPSSRFDYIGVDPDSHTGFVLADAQKGEYENAAKPFETDPYGCHSKVLKTKRRERNPFHRTPPYQLSCPSMQSLLKFCGPELIDAGAVPWKGD